MAQVFSAPVIPTVTIYFCKNIINTRTGQTCGRRWKITTSSAVHKCRECGVTGIYDNGVIVLESEKR